MENLLLNNLKEKALRLKVEREALEESLNESRLKQSTLRNNVDINGKVVGVFSQFIDVLWEDTKKVTETLVTSGLKDVFDSGLEFKLNVETKKNQVYCEPYVLDGGMEIDVLDSDGGGLVDCISILLRVCLLLLAKPAKERILIMDEPMKHLSEAHVPVMVDFLKDLSEKFGIQFIIATHIKDFKRIGKHFIVEKDAPGVKGKTIIKELEEVDGRESNQELAKGQ